MMNDDDLLRYSRQIMLPQLDVAGQEKLLAARVLVVGLGGLGSPAAMYLAAAGVGYLLLADNDSVDLSNLQRQIIHDTSDIGKPKVISAQETLSRINPGVQVRCLEHRLEGEAMRDAIESVDVVVDCTDNFSTRFAINDTCVAVAVPLVSAAAIRMEGQVSVFDMRRDDSPCYRCLYEASDDMDLSCARNGVMSPLVGVLGSLQAMETLKLIAGVGTSLSGRLLLYDAVSGQFREMILRKRQDCPVCGN